MLMGENGGGKRMLRVTDNLNHQVGRKGNYATCHEWPSD